MRFVLDTDVILSGLRSPAGASRILLIAAWDGIIVPLVSVAMMIEYEAVLKRAEHLADTSLKIAEIDGFLDNMALICEPIAPHFSHRPSIRDPDDELFFEAALNGAADALVTFNVKDYLPADPARKDFGIAICRPGDVLRRLEWRPSQDMLSAFRPRSWTR